MFSLYSLVATGVPPAASLTAYPAPDGAPTSDLFGVSVSQVGSGLTVQPAVFSTSSAARCAQVSQWNWHRLHELNCLDTPLHGFNPPGTSPSYIACVSYVADTGFMRAAVGISWVLGTN